MIQGAKQATVVGLALLDFSTWWPRGDQGPRANPAISHLWNGDEDMARKGKSTEEIIGFLREAEVRLGQGEHARLREGLSIFPTELPSGSACPTSARIRLSSADHSPARALSGSWPDQSSAHRTHAAQNDNCGLCCADRGWDGPTWLTRPGSVCQSSQVGNSRPGGLSLQTQINNCLAPLVVGLLRDPMLRRVSHLFSTLVRQTIKPLKNGRGSPSDDACQAVTSGLSDSSRARLTVGAGPTICAPAAHSISSDMIASSSINRMR
jgi:hypothetical protein